LGSTVTSSGAEPVGPALTPKLGETLREEMRLVLGASQDILAALVAGDHATVAERARNIHDSFILERSLTEQELRDLEEAVPPAFLELDQEFHRTAAELAAAARAGDAAREAELFGRMVQDCAACHGRFAADRFPGLGPRQAPRRPTETTPGSRG
jgi:mono/diheme cytochrome c family protein